MRDKVLAFWRAQALPEDTAVTCAVSGGADSVAMLHALCALACPADFTGSALYHAIYCQLAYDEAVQLHGDR